MRKLFLIAALTLLLVGCSKLDSGVVIDKRFEPAHTRTRLVVRHTGKTSHRVFQTYRIPDRWYITIQGEYKGKARIEKVSVSQAEYEQLAIGGFYQTVKE